MCILIRNWISPANQKNIVNKDSSGGKLSMETKARNMKRKRRNKIIRISMSTKIRYFTLHVIASRTISVDEISSLKSIKQTLDWQLLQFIYTFLPFCLICYTVLYYGATKLPQHLLLYNYRVDYGFISTKKFNITLPAKRIDHPEYE